MMKTTRKNPPFDQQTMKYSGGGLKVSFAALLFFHFIIFNLSAQTSWKGTSSTSWSNTSNWSNGVPTSNTDVIIGDASFTGAFQPKVSKTSKCKSLTIGSGTKASTLTVAKSLTASGTVTIGSNGTITHTGSILSLTA